MGLFDKAKQLAEEHAEQVGDAIDKVAGLVDDKTGGKYADKIEKGADAAKGFVAGDGEHVTAGDDEGPAADGPPAGDPPAAAPPA